MAVVNPQEVPGLIQRTLNQLDPRLVDHGHRVAYFVSCVLKMEGGCTHKQYQDLCMLALLHDVGAYKTEEIDHMLQFESKNVWNHAVYGYLFLRDMSPLREYAPAILFHHLDYQHHARLNVVCGREAQLLYIADRADILRHTTSMTPDEIMRTLAAKMGTQFDPSVLQLFLRACTEYDLLGDHLLPTMEELLGEVELTEEDVQSYLKMLVFTLDFRSKHTVTNAVTTTCIAVSQAQNMGLDEATQDAIYYGTLLHDIGKVGVPVEILDYPGKLSPQAVAVVKTHVDITDRILGNAISEDAKRIALRHHEKLDGSGYPAGLRGSELSLAERIVAVADIVGALGGTRTYKDAFPKRTTLEIIQRMAQGGQLDPQIVDNTCRHFDAIMDNVRAQSTPILRLYESTNREYNALVDRYIHGKR